MIYGVNDVQNVLQNVDNKDIVSGKKSSYYTSFGTFDIETTSLHDRGFMYIWQFCIGEYVVMGRTWEEFLQLYDIINTHFNLKKAKFVCYVHNLPFEFMFIKDFFQWSRVFALEEEEPIQAVTRDGWEFRCSYKLSNMSLAKFCEASDGCTHYKKDGESFNYRKKRTYKSKLTNRELLYCYCDVKGLHECIEYRLRDDTLATIPITSTGYVRRRARNAMQTNPYNRELLLNTRLDSFLYIFLRTGRRGGDCHASSVYSGQFLNDVDSWDLKSSYPYVMMCCKFPVTPFLEFRPEDLCKQQGRACIMEVEFENIRVKSPWHIPYIPVAKCQLKEGWTLSSGKRKNWINDNGRVMGAGKVRMILTDIDLELINAVYDIEKTTVIRGFSAEYGYLPKEFRQVVADYFQEKTDLEGGDIYYYNRKKNETNSLFGMMLTDNCKETVCYYNSEWKTKQEGIEVLLNRYYKSHSSFLPYQWGLWVTAHARRRLHEPVIRGNLYKYGIYTDTDSWKMLNGYLREIFETINREVIEKAESYDVKPYAINRKTGEKVYLGTWEYEGKCNTFITHGAKKYAYTKDVKDKKTGELIKDKLHVTVAGLNKEGASWYLQQLKGIGSFTRGRVFPARYKGHKVSGRTVSVYNDVGHAYTESYDGVEFTSASNIAIYDTTYTLGITEDYDKLLKRVKTIVN